jgi:hypothetical protein
MRVAGWKMSRTLSGVFSMRNEETGEVLRGPGAEYLCLYMRKTGWPIECLDRRSWVWTAYDDTGDGFKKLYSWPDSRPYPYPAEARR